MGFFEKIGILIQPNKVKNPQEIVKTEYPEKNKDDRVTAKSLPDELKQLLDKYISGKDFKFKNVLFTSYRLKQEKSHFYTLLTRHMPLAAVIDSYQDAFEFNKSRDISDDPYSDWGYSFFKELDKILLLFQRNNGKLSDHEQTTISAKSVEYLYEKIKREVMTAYESVLTPVIKEYSSAEAKPSKRSLIKSLAKSAPRLSDNEIIIGLLLDKFEMKYTYEELEPLINNVKEEIDLDTFEQNLGTMKIEKLGSFENLNGHEFEAYLKKLFTLKGYSVKRPNLSGDQGADLILESSQGKTVVQAKHKATPVNNKAVQEVVAAKKYYGANESLVVCTNSYTKSAIELAKINGVELWDKKRLKEEINQINNEASNKTSESDKPQQNKLHSDMRWNPETKIAEIQCPSCKKEFESKVENVEKLEGLSLFCPHCGGQMSGIQVTKTRNNPS
jgi:hypothetical protein